MELYLRNSLQCSRITTKNYSTSFSLAIRLLNPRYKDPIYAIYGFVRFADEIVDTFFSQNQQKEINEFKKDAFIAIENNYSPNPIIHSFQWVVNRFNIDKELIEAFFNSMEMDLYVDNHDNKGFNEYVYGSAEVVGLMCLRVFCYGDNVLFDNLKHYARSLGAAYQKVNFFRDLSADYIDRGRTYFPDIDMKKFDNDVKVKIEKDIEKDFKDSLAGIKKLPNDARIGVFLSYSYYLALFRKIKRTDAKELINKRIRISNFRKILIMLISIMKNSTGIIR